jgi:YVTN family beta-propeller protein
MRRPGHLSTVLALFALPFLPAAAHATPFAYVGDGNVPIHLQVIDVATNTVVASPTFGLDEVDCCSGPEGVAVSPTGDRAYIATSGHGRLFVLDTATNTFVTNIVLNGDPFGVWINPSGTRVYVAASSGNVVYVVDTATNAVLTSIPVPGGPRGLVVSPDGTRVYTANFNAGTVSKIDTATNTVLGSVTLPNGPFGSPLPEELVITPDGATLYVAKTNTFEVAVIDTASNTLLTNINTQNGPQGIAINPAGTRVYVGHGFAGVIKVIDTATNTVADTINVASQSGLSVTPDGTRLYAARSNAPAAVTVVDTATDATVTTITGFRARAIGNFIGPFCPGACNDGNPCTTDSCNIVSGCTYTNNTAPCASDGNDCTTDVCNGAGTCTHPDAPAGTSCNDGTFCNGADTCDGAGGCTNHVGDPCTVGPECAQTCNEVAGNCFDPVTTPCTSDGNVCTDDHCNGAGACAHTNNTAPCDDGLFCNGTDTCAGGMCTHSGDPCVGGPDCAHTCNEASDNCFDPAGAACAPDTNPCTLERCDGAGVCTHPAGNAGAVCRPPAGQCDVAETCTGTSTTCPADGFQPNGTACDDGNACTTADSCTNGACVGGPLTVCPLCQTCVAPTGCAVGPRAGCQAVTVPRGAFLELKRGTPTKNNKVTFNWTKGAATSFAQLGDPLTTDDYAVCVFDTTGPSLLLKATAPAGGTCAGKACWKRLGSATNPKGWKYGDKDATPDGLTGVQANSSPVAGKSKVAVKGKGDNLPVASFVTVSGPVTAQVQAGNGTCWSAACSVVTKNGGGDFKCKGE